MPWFVMVVDSQAVFIFTKYGQDALPLPEKCY